MGQSNPLKMYITICNCSCLTQIFPTVYCRCVGLIVSDVWDGLGGFLLVQRTIKNWGQSEALAEAKQRNTLVDEKHTYDYNYTQ